MILIINNSKKLKTAYSTPKLIEFLKINGVEYDVINNIKDLKYYVKNKALIKGAILSGSDLLYSEKINYNKINLNTTILLEFNIPVLGICFGFQSIGLFYGGSISKLKSLNYCCQKISFDNNNKLFKNIDANSKFFQFHNDYLEDVPDSFKVIAKSNKNVVNGIQHVEKKIYGVQFHPELSGSNGEKLLKNFLEICNI